jgi:hypothetical protein
MLTMAQQIELLLGPGPGSAFTSDAERRAAWLRHRAELLALEAPGHRPWAWRAYEGPARNGGSDRE